MADDIESALERLESALKLLKTRKSIETFVNSAREREKSDLIEFRTKQKSIKATAVKEKVPERKDEHLDDYLHYGELAQLAEKTHEKIMSYAPKALANFEDADYDVAELLGVARDLLEYEKDPSGKVDPKRKLVSDKAWRLIGGLELLANSPVLDHNLSEQRDFHVDSLLRVHREYLPEKHTELAHHKL